MSEFPSHASLVVPAEFRSHLAGISLRGEADVLEALGENGAASGLVGEAHARLGGYFPEADFALEVFDDPESDAPSARLVLSVITDRAPADAWARLKEFHREWWLSVLGRAVGVLSVTLECC